jgi:D-erythro-7,8-dihydroneopterin triphosphate epimerase
LNTAKIRISNLSMRVLVGIKPQERMEKQRINAHLEIIADVSRAIETDNIDDAVNYDILAKAIVEESEKTEFYLLENLADFILGLIMEEEKVIQATVRVEKPQALKYADSVSVELSAERFS